MKIIRLIQVALLTVVLSITYGQTTIDATGIYKYKGKTSVVNGQVFGPYSGIISVKKVTDTSIAMSFFICKGAPSFNNGSFEDTLSYHNNLAVYTVPNIDSSCNITFHFKNKSVVVKENAADYNSGCGFGHAVVADGIFKKYR